MEFISLTKLPDAESYTLNSVAVTPTDGIYIRTKSTGTKSMPKIVISIGKRILLKAKWAKGTEVAIGACSDGVSVGIYKPSAAEIAEAEAEGQKIKLYTLKFQRSKSMADIDEAYIEMPYDKDLMTLLGLYHTKSRYAVRVENILKIRKSYVQFRTRGTVVGTRFEDALEPQQEEPDIAPPIIHPNQVKIERDVKKPVEKTARTSPIKADPEIDRCITILETAGYLGISEEKCWQLHFSGFLPSFNIGSDVRVRLSDLKACIDNLVEV